MIEWQPIETAPKDCWVQLWRPGAIFGTRSPFIIAKWSDANQSFIWPTKIYDPWHDPADAECLLEDDFYADTDFTHWKPLPEPPK